MARRRKHTWIALIVLLPGVLVAAIGGLWVFMSVTATPIHPDPQGVPSAALAAPTPKWTSAVEQARQITRAAVAEQNLPGLSVAVGAGGNLVWAEGFGWADLDGRRPVTPETRFRALGVSMALTSAAVGLLVEQNRLKLDEEIQTYVPEFPKKQWPVTVRQLMGHVAGVRNDGGDEAPLLTHCERTLDGLQLDDFANRSLRFEPGTEYRYSTYGWVLVSAAVDNAAGEPFFRYIHGRVFEPLGMTGTRPEAWLEPIPNRATFYFPRFAADTRYGPESVREGDHSCWSGALAFLSTPSDLVRFGLAFNSGKLLKPDTVKTLLTSQRLTSGAETGHGLGWTLETMPLGGEPTRLAGQHDQRSIGGSASLILLPQRALVVAVMTNITFVDTPALAVSIAGAFTSRAERRP